MPLNFTGLNLLNVGAEDKQASLAFNIKLGLTNEQPPNAQVNVVAGVSGSYGTSVTNPNNDVIGWKWSIVPFNFFKTFPVQLIKALSFSAQFPPTKFTDATHNFWAGRFLIRSNYSGQILQLSPSDAQDTDNPPRVYTVSGILPFFCDSRSSIDIVLEAPFVNGAVYTNAPLDPIGLTLTLFNFSIDSVGGIS
jgi:hypothetical protein